MRRTLALALVLGGLGCGIASAQQPRYASQKSQSAKKTSIRKVSDEETLVQEPQTATIGSSKGTNAPGGDYGLGQPLCAPQYSLEPKPTCTEGGYWWCDPCGFGGFGCGTPVRTFARNVHTQFTSLIPCGPWCQARGCNCSGQSPYPMDGSKPDRRSRQCDCAGSYYLFPWIWGYNPSRKGCCINQWTQRGDGYRSSLQFNQQPSPEFPYEDEAAPAPAPSVMEAPKSASHKVRNVSHETAASKKPASVVVRETAPSQSEEESAESAAPRKPMPTGALSANYLTRVMPRQSQEVETHVATPSKATSSRRK
jgi:hypothetical protein